MEGLVFAADTCSVVDQSTGLKVRLTAGEAWAADDPFVKSRPHLFLSWPQLVRRTAPVQPAVSAPVESATKVPGVKRTVKNAAE